MDPLPFTPNRLQGQPDPGLPKAELHVHLEGSTSPALVRAIADRNKLPLPANLFDERGEFAWTGFTDFLRCYDTAASVIRTQQDYYDLTLAYLAQSAQEGGIYTEFFISSDHAEQAGLSYAAMLDALSDAVRTAEEKHGITARFVQTGVRHYGEERVMRAIHRALRHPHPLVTGFGLAGNEITHPVSLFRDAFMLAQQAGLGLTAHAGEAAGAESVNAALDLPITRLGHGVRAIEDQGVLDRAIARGITFEVCPSSNIATGVYPAFASHPLNALKRAGARVTLASDDPPFFATSLGIEYARAAEEFGWTAADQLEATETAIAAAFVDAPTRARLQARIAAYKANNP